MPDSNATIALSFGHGSARTQHIHRASPASGLVGRYYPRPLFSLKMNPSPLEGCPPYVHKSAHNGGKVELTFAFLVTTDEYKQLCKRLVYLQDRDHVLKAISGLPAETRPFPVDVIKVDRWPIEDVEVRCIRKGPAPYEILAVGRAQFLTGMVDVFDCVIPFTPAALSRFEELARKDEVQFLCCYSYTGAKTGIVTREISALRNIRSTLEAVFASRQGQGDAIRGKLDGAIPIFQSEKNEVETELMGRITTSVIASGPQLLPLLTSIVPTAMERLFTRWGAANDATFERLSSSDPQVRAALAAYLTPHLQSLTKVKAVNDVTAETVENEKISLMQGGLSVSVPIKKINISGNFGLQGAERDLKRWESASGVRLETVEQGTTYAAHEISVYRLAQHWDREDFFQSDQICVNMGKESSWRVESPVSADFNDVTVSKAVQEALEDTPDQGLQEKQAELERRESLKRARAQLSDELKTKQQELTALKDKRDKWMKEHPPRQRVVVSGSMFCSDHETFGPNETGRIDIKEFLQQRKTPEVGDFVLSRGGVRPAKRLVELAVGDEIWATVDMSAACDPTGVVAINLYLRLYESDHVPNTDLDGSRDVSFTVEPGHAITKVERVTNEDEDEPEDYMEPKIVVTNSTVVEVCPFEQQIPTLEAEIAAIEKRIGELRE